MEANINNIMMVVKKRINSKNYEEPLPISKSIDMESYKKIDLDRKIEKEDVKKVNKDNRLSESIDRRDRRV